ncbi:NAD(P)-dependent oxidoreductase, partial [bacterium]|nr:NAD(P)-dependent oxidoreductase [bacterium]
SNLQWLDALPVEFIYGELTDFDSLKAAVTDVDVVVHLGGKTRARSEADFFRINSDGTEKLLNACQRFNPTLEKFVFVSSMAAAGPAQSGQPLIESMSPKPIVAYGKSKARAEEYVIQYKSQFPVAIVRPPAVYGPRDKDVYQIFRYVNWGFNPQLAGEAHYTSMVHVSDLVQGILLAVEKKMADNPLYYIAGDGVFSWNEITACIASVLGKCPVSIKIPGILAHLGAIAAEGIAGISNKPPLLSRDKVVEMKQPYWVCDTTKAKNELGYFPKFDLKMGVTQTAQWYQQQGWL